MSDLPQKAIKAVNAIVEDICDRRGIGNEWEGMDEDIQGEIMTKWVGIIVEECGP